VECVCKACVTCDLQVDANTHTLAKYLMELTIVEYDLVHISPSEIAAASLCLSMKLSCDSPEWVKTVSRITYTVLVGT